MPGNFKYKLVLSTQTSCWNISNKMRNIIVTCLCLFGLMLILTVSCLADVIFPDHHQHNHEHSSVKERDAQQTNNDIPLDVILQLNNIDSFAGLQDFLNEESLRAAGIQFRDLDTSVNNRFGDDDERDGNAPVIPKYAKCMLEMQSVELMAPTNGTRQIYYPGCTRVERCGGCCTHELLSCQPTLSEQLPFQVIVSEYAGNGKFDYKGKEIITVEQHLKCKCDCRIKETDCTRFQDYRKSECRCVCRNIDDEKKCLAENDTKIWDPQNCVCLCRETKQCSTDYFFSQETCSCAEVLRRRRFGSSVDTRLRRENNQPPITYPLPVLPLQGRYERKSKEN